MKRRLTALLLVLALCLNLLPTVYAAEAATVTEASSEAEEEENPVEEVTVTVETQSDRAGYSTLDTVSYTYVNPEYEGEIDEDDLASMTQTSSATTNVTTSSKARSSSSTTTLYATDYNYTLEDAAADFREQMKAHAETITVLYCTDSGYISYFSDISSAAMEHTGVADEGDYLLKQYGGYTVNITGVRSDAVYYITYTYTINYYTTLEQETAVTERLEQVMAELIDDDMTDAEKALAIYDYICKNVTYDYDNLDDSTYKLKHTAYAALINGTAVCQGYAVLFYRMALMAGLDARYISGTVTTTGESHGWNIVQIGTMYYNLDSPWDSENYAEGFVPLCYDYFLLSDETFLYHGRNAIYSTDDFYEAYPMAEENYPLTKSRQTAILADGDCGEDVWWSLTYDGTLTISGTGDMTDYARGAAPWYAVARKITALVIEVDVNALGDFAFFNFTSLTDVTLASSVVSIGNYTFANCTALEMIEFYARVESIGTAAYVGATAQEENVFEGNAPTIEANAFTGVTAIAFYPEDDSSWTENVLTNYGGSLTWVSYPLSMSDASTDSNVLDGSVETTHDYTNATIEWNWADDYLSCVATIYCSTCGSGTDVDCIVMEVDGQEASCEDDGYRRYIAAVKVEGKNSYNIATIVTPATGHTAVTTPAVAATCTTAGRTESVSCSECGKTLVESSAIDAEGHIIGTSIAATCTTDGYDYCAVCGEALFTGAAKGHDYSSCTSKVTKTPTYTSTGTITYTYTCTRCGDSYSESESVDKLETTSIKGADITLSTTSYTYNGSARTPSVVVELDGEKLIKGTDYTVSYKNNTNVGTATVTITGKGNYKGSVQATFTINAKSLSSASVKLSTTSYTYSGSAKKPTPTVTLSGTKLTKGTDYSVSYKYIKNVGTATVTITGTGNYKGTVKATFTIKKLTPTITAAFTSKTLYYGSTGNYAKLSASTNGDAKLTYKSSNTKVATVSSSGKITATGVGTATITITSAATDNCKKTTKTIKITVKSLSAPSISKLTNSASKTLKVALSKKVSNATGYEIRYSTSASFSSYKSVKITSASTLTKTISSLTKNKTYYVKVRAYKTVGSSTAYSKWSTVMSLMITIYSFINPNGQNSFGLKFCPLLWRFRLHSLQNPDTIN